MMVLDYIHKSHNAPALFASMHHGALLDMGHAHYGICEVGVLHSQTVDQTLQLQYPHLHLPTGEFWSEKCRECKENWLLYLS